MECSVTSTEALSGKGRSSGGYTLVEILIVSALGLLALSGFSQIVFHTGRSFAAVGNYVELDRRSRNALDQMIGKIRQADSLTAFATNRLVFSYQRTNTLVYAYSASDKTLTETLGSDSKVLLTGCDRLVFSIFQRNTADGTYDQFPATMTNSAAKLIQVGWVCSRTVLGKLVNTESVQSAKIVIRNQ